MGAKFKSRHAVQGSVALSECTWRGRALDTSHPSHAGILNLKSTSVASIAHVPLPTSKVFANNRYECGLSVK